MFQDLEFEVIQRFTAVEQYFRLTRRFQGEPARMAKGLMFVQIYAIYEYTFTKVFQAAAHEIACHAHSYSVLRPSLQALFLDGKFQSLRQCSPKKEWESRLDLLDAVSSSDHVEAIQAPLPVDGSHFRHTHLLLMLRVLGVSAPATSRRRHLHRIDEVVNHRNTIAHGEVTPGEIGRRYSRDEIHTIRRQMRGVCLRLIRIVAEHSRQPSGHRKEQAG